MLAPGDELQGEQDRDDLEDVRGAAGGQRQRRQAEQDDEEDREALLLEELDEPKRELFALVELDELSVPEAADALEIPLNTAYSRLRAARLAFEAALALHEARAKG